MRRLPVFFVLDCSESMVGENLKKMEDGLQSIIKILRSDPHSLESVYISIIAFAGIAKTIVPLVEVVSFYPPKLPLGGGTSLGAALDALMLEFDKSVVKTTPDMKGDWKPIVYLFTDGRPTDNPLPAVHRWHDNYAHKANLIAVSLGNDADFPMLKKITDNVIVFEDTKDGDFKKFVNWISASVLAQSKSVSKNIENIDFPVFDESVMKIIKESQPIADEACVTLVGRCQKTRKPYIMKYDRDIKSVATRDFKIDISNYHLAGCYPLEEDYFAWSDNNIQDLKINTSSLIGSPGCPHCGNFTAFAVCGCSKLLCINKPGEAICPWCKNTVSFGVDSSSDEGGFDVDRGRG